MEQTISDSLTSRFSVPISSPKEDSKKTIWSGSFFSLAERLLVQCLEKIKLIGVFTCGVMPIPIVADVLSRLFIGKSLTGIIELEEFMMVLIVFLSLAFTQWQKGQISIDLVLSRISERKQMAIQYFMDAWGCYKLLFVRIKNLIFSQDKLLC